ncbi:MAG TPA: DUF1684 domain-containing protein [Gammaproteobacteria bacterium]|nr:DUF1684 domain-containing protein [Gammaproteobacteria bacterium]
MSARGARLGAGASRAVLAAVLGAAVAGCQAETPAPLEWSDAVVTQIEAWRAQHEDSYRRNWAPIEGLHFLKPGAQSAGSAPGNDVVLIAALPERLGTFTVAADQVTFTPDPDAAITLNGEAAAAPTVLRDDGEDDTDVIEANGASVVVHRSGPRLSLRVRDPNGARARAFAGFDWFPISRDYRVLGRFIADAAPRSLPVVNTFGDVDEYPSDGAVEFVLNGATLRLRPFTTEPGRLYFVFNDASSGEETYAAARFLYSDLRPDGTTVLDFNEAYNPPCSFNPFTTCPVPLRENRLPVKVLAGEKKYRGAEP